MALRSLKSILAAAFSLFFICSSIMVSAQHHAENAGEKTAEGAVHEEKFNASEVIFGHILDNHEYHITEWHDAEGVAHHLSIPLPIILYSPQRGLSAFMSSQFHHGEFGYNGYAMLNNNNMKLWKLDAKKFHAGDIVAINDKGVIDETVKVYDLSITRNVVQMFLALAVLTWLMLSIAKSYKRGQGVTSAPKGKQNLLEPVITFVRDEVAKPNLGHKYEKYLPYLLTTFFFILINNIFGLIPGTANVTGNIAFTVVLGVISFVVIMASTNKHFWAHIFNPPGVPGFVKPILILVRILGLFIKPFDITNKLCSN